jgi:hypothetical protein
MLLFELGELKIFGSRIACEEITIKTSYELNPRYVSDQINPFDLAPTKNKIEFTIKKPKIIENDILFYLATQHLPFGLDLYRIINSDDVAQTQYAKINPGIRGTYTELANGDILQKYMTLYGCTISDAQFGNFDGTKPVTEDIQGQAIDYAFDSGVSAYYDSILSNVLNDY